MSSLSEWFGWGTGLTGLVRNIELPEMFPLPIQQNIFIEIQVVTLYSKILTDALERTHGLSDEQTEMMWDNCVKSNSSDGLITMLAKAMADKQDLFLVYDKEGSIIRRATGSEQSEIRADYEKQASSSHGTYISFKSMKRSDMIKLYVALEFCMVGSLNKSMNLSSAIQLKMNDLRGSVSLTDSASIKTQAQYIAQGLAAGQSVMIDSKDSIETAVPDLTATQAAMSFLDQKLSMYLGMPASYLDGQQTTGMGSSGENDMRAVERGLRSYYFSVLKPVLESLFGASVSYKSQDFRQIEGAMDVLKTFQLIDDDLVSTDNKRIIVNSLLGIQEDDIEPDLEQGDNEDIQVRAMSGPQISSMLQIVTEVAAGTIPPESGVQILMLSFQLSEEDALAVIADSGNGFEAPKPVPPMNPFAPHPANLPQPANDPNKPPQDKAALVPPVANA